MLAATTLVGSRTGDGVVGARWRLEFFHDWWLSLPPQGLGQGPWGWGRSFEGAGFLSDVMVVFGLGCEPENLGCTSVLISLFFLVWEPWLVSLCELEVWARLILPQVYTGMHAMVMVVSALELASFPFSCMWSEGTCWQWLSPCLLEAGPVCKLAPFPPSLRTFVVYGHLPLSGSSVGARGTATGAQCGWGECSGVALAWGEPQAIFSLLPQHCDCE